MIQSDYPIDLTRYKSIICLHGFLGLPGDWSPIKVPHYAPDLFTDELQKPLSEIGETLCELIRKFPSPRLLIGYSMGGRLALHALREDPQIVDEAVLISTHLGLESVEEKEARISSDLLWAERFEKEDWDLLMSDWNAQPIFQGDFRVRNEQRCSRKHLAFALREWSLGKQDCFYKEKEPFVQERVILVAGEKDQKFVAHSNELKSYYPRITRVIVPDVGHRVIFESKETFDKVFSCGNQ